MNDSTQPDGPASTPTIAEALDKNKDATEEVKKVADDLLVVHAVLKKEVGQNTQPTVVDQAVQQASDLEKRLTQSAELLDEVNETLEQAIQSSGSGSEQSSPPQTAPRSH
jgi:hypothetical protein